jgi:hypothetical protein
LLLEPPFWRSLGRLARRFAGDPDWPNRAGAGISFLDLPPYLDTIDEREIDTFSRRRLDFLMRFVKKCRFVEAVQPGDRIERTPPVFGARQREVRNELKALQ